MSTAVIRKPLGIKAYGSIPHLPDSRMGPGDHHCEPGMAVICTRRRPDAVDEVIVTEKLDGSCVAVAKVGGQIVPLNRAGYRAGSSPYEQHHLFEGWALRRWELFDALLEEGERVVGEWLAQSHGTRYDLPHEPFVPFDLMRGAVRVQHDVFMARIGAAGLVGARLLHRGGPVSVEVVASVLESSGRGALDPVEGAVWRVERGGAVDFLAKWVRPEKVDGCYLPEVSGADAVWNWRP